jgi:ketosteroid isomerase-like protein
MSGNVEVVRQAMEAQGSDYLRGCSEEERSARRVALWDPECEYTSFIAAVESATYHGHDGIRRYLSDLGERWAEWRAEPEAFVDVSPDTVFVSFRFHAVGKDSSVPVEARLGSVLVLSRGKLMRGRTYPSREEALEAAGLRERDLNG